MNLQLQFIEHLINKQYFKPPSIGELLCFLPQKKRGSKLFLMGPADKTAIQQQASN
jgi:hypothetical protein